MRTNHCSVRLQADPVVAMTLKRVVLLTLVLVALVGLRVDAQRSLVIERFDSVIQVNADGTVDVTENIKPRFAGTWNGIFRTIPVEYRTPQAFNYTLRLDILSVSDGEGHALRYESGRERHYRKIKIWVPDARDATRTVVLGYRARNGLRFFEEHDELYWNVTGDEWEVPIEDVTARILLPPGVTGLRAVAFTGGYGSEEQAASVETGDGEVNVRMRRRLNFKEGLTVAVGWDPGKVARPSRADKGAEIVRSNLALLVPPVVFLGMWRLWYSRGRDPRLRPITPRYEPPADLSPAEVGTLVDHSSDMRDITATVVDLAVRGHIAIHEEKEERLFGLFGSTDYRFVLLKKREDWVGIKPHERRLLTALFKEGNGEAARHELVEVTLSDLRNQFYKKLPDIKNGIFQKLAERGYYTSRPDRVRTAYLIAGAIIGAVVGFGGVALSAAQGIQPVPAIIAGVLTAAIVCGFGWFMPLRTLQGTRAMEETLGFEDFLRRVEADRLDRTMRTPEMFEKYLPFAMALGVEHNWAKAFEGIYQQPPGWYYGTSGQGFQPRAFVNSLGNMSEQTASVMTSAPRSSGGSGFSGGSSGGGFGGGGGGGF